MCEKLHESTHTLRNAASTCMLTYFTMVTCGEKNISSVRSRLKKFKLPASPDPTYRLSSPRKNPDILDIFVTKVPYSLYCSIHSSLDINPDHSSVLLTLNDYPLVLPEVSSMREWLRVYINVIFIFPQHIILLY